MDEKESDLAYIDHKNKKKKYKKIIKIIHWPCIILGSEALTIQCGALLAAVLGTLVQYFSFNIHHLVCQH